MSERAFLVMRDGERMTAGYLDIDSCVRFLKVFGKPGEEYHLAPFPDAEGGYTVRFSESGGFFRDNPPDAEYYIEKLEELAQYERQNYEEH